MSEDKFQNNLGSRILFLIRTKGINQSKLSEILKLSNSYLTEIIKQRTKKGGLKFWDSIRREFPEWLDFLQGNVKDPPEAPKWQRGSTILTGHIQPYAQPEEKMGVPHRDADKGSYGAPDLGDHRIIKVITPEDQASHEDIIGRFKNKTAAREINLKLLKLEKLAPGKLEYIRGVLDGIIEGLEIKKNQNHS